LHGTAQEKYGQRLRLRSGRALRCAAQEKSTCDCNCDCDWAQESMIFHCDCDWAEPCTALRKKATCNCDWAEPCAALRKKNTSCSCDCDWA